MHKYFAEWYRVATIEPKRELLEDRWQAIEGFLKSMDMRRAMDLVRLFYGRPLNDGDFEDAYRAEFQKKDPAFPMRGNDLELRVLAGATIVCGLEQCTTKMADAIALATICMFCKGLRGQALVPEIITSAENHLVKRCVRLRSDVDLQPIKAPGLKIDDVFAGLEEALQSGNFGALSEPLKNSLEKIRSILVKQSAQSSHAINALIKIVRFQQEETNILWWLFGAYSRDLDIRIADLEVPAVCLLAGKELGDLVVALPGPVSAIAFLERVLLSVKPELPESVTILEAVNASDGTWKSKWIGERSVEGFMDLCPIHLAAQKSLDVSRANEWLPLFENKAGFKAGETLSPLDLSMQVYREGLLLRTLAGGV